MYIVEPVNSWQFQGCQSPCLMMFSPYCTQHKARVSELEGKGAPPSGLVSLDQLTQSQPGEQTMPTTLLRAPPDFQTFLRPCWESKIIIVHPWPSSELFWFISNNLALNIPWRCFVFHQKCKKEGVHVQPIGHHPNWSLPKKGNFGLEYDPQSSAFVYLVEKGSHNNQF